MKPGRSALYVCYYHAEEALVRHQVIAYLRELAARGFRIHLLTFEKERLAEPRRRRIREELRAMGIVWHQQRYHSRPSLPATLYDTLVGSLASWYLCVRHRLWIVHARSHVPGAMSLGVAGLLRRPFLFDFRGLLAEEYADAGRWRPGSLKYRLTKAMEARCFAAADAVVVLTRKMRADLLAARGPASPGRPVDVIPCCVELERFSSARQGRAAYRRERGWSERLVLAYLGKLSPLYMPEELVSFFLALRQREPSAFFQVLTPSDAAPVERALRAAGASSADYDVRLAAGSEVPRILAACDATISLRRGALSARAASPTKLGEALAAGLPVVTNRGVGDCDEILAENRVGVVLDGLAGKDLAAAARSLLDLLHDAGLPARCQDVAARELSLGEVGGPRYARIYERLAAVANEPPAAGESP